MGERIERAKKVIGSFYKLAKCGLFFTRNMAGDNMQTIYDDGEVVVDICEYWEYFEVFGLNEEEQKELLEYYNKMRGR